jgi:hypothetical protein
MTQSGSAGVAAEYESCTRGMLFLASQPWPAKEAKVHHWCERYVGTALRFLQPAELNIWPTSSQNPSDIELEGAFLSDRIVQPVIGTGRKS